MKKNIFAKLCKSEMFVIYYKNIAFQNKIFQSRYLDPKLLGQEDSWIKTTILKVTTVQLIVLVAFCHNCYCVDSFQMSQSFFRLPGFSMQILTNKNLNLKQNVCWILIDFHGQIMGDDDRKQIPNQNCKK